VKKLQNTLFITRQECYVHKERDTLVIEHKREKLMQLPAHSIGQLHCFGQIMMSPALMGYCGEQGIGVSFYTEYGRFLARVQGAQSGNVLLRREQYRRADDNPISIARPQIAAKIASTRAVLQRHCRNHGDDADIRAAIDRMATLQTQLPRAQDLDGIREIEGEAASRYFNCFAHLILARQRDHFPFNGRNRRPPLDAVNALLSFIYTLITQETASALQGVGLDPYVGFLHRDRPGRVSLALDVLEEFRAFWADRLVLSLINRKQLKPSDFDTQASGAVLLKDEPRKAVLTAYQARKKEEIEHPYLQEKVAIGLLPHVQSQLLARHLRGDMEHYPPFTQA
jgi:CRISPR-associated protein Cas1